MVSMVETSNEHNDTVMEPMPKTEPGQDGSLSSMSTPDAEAEPMTQDPAQTQKRKGGRKPVRTPRISALGAIVLTLLIRSTPPPRNASSAIARPRLHFASVGQSTSASWKPPSSGMKTPCKACSRAIAAPPMSA